MGLLSKVTTRRATLFAIMAMFLASSDFLAQAAQVPCFHIFGDSLSDNGNNNDLITLAKANFPPYGVDGPAGVELGRFSNGKNVPDVLSHLMGFQDYIKPFRTATGSEILQGVNYASGGSGIRDETGIIFGGRYPLSQQVLHHKITVARTTVLLGSQAATARLKKCIYYINIGSNDYISNYFFPSNFITSSLYTPDQYAADLIQKYSDQLKILYILGARKIALVGLGRIGDTPVEVTTFAANSAKLNDAAALFNTKLVQLVDALNQNFPDAKFTYLDTYVATSPLPITFTNTTGPCCELGSIVVCRRNDLNICPDRTKYVFFDNIHPTEAVSIFLGNGFYYANTASSPPEAHPYNIQQLVQAP